MTRTPLPARREHITDHVKHVGAGGFEYTYIVSYGFDSDNRCKEMFCTTAAKEGSDLQSFINDSCVLFSILLQHGVSISEIAEAMGENRAEGAVKGPPSSPLGALARRGAALEAGL